MGNSLVTQIEIEIRSKLENFFRHSIPAAIGARGRMSDQRAQHEFFSLGAPDNDNDWNVECWIYVVL